MTAQFALSLSPDGIDLLHLADDGWGLVGHADVNSSTLDADLATLRAAADTIAPDGFVCKVVVPSDQIKVLTLDTPDATEAEVHAALEGATPYSLFDLEVDHITVGEQTLVAAVARETLEEAESFADGHGFRPVAFVANPPVATGQEFFFGPSSILAELLGPDATVERAAPALVAQKEKQPDAPAAEADTSPDELVPAPPPAARQVTTNNPILFDAVIAEVHDSPKPKPKPVLAATAPIQAPAPKVAPVAAPIRQAPNDAPARSRLPLVAGLSVAAALAVGAIGYAILGGGNDSATPASVGSDIAEAPLQTAPEIGQLNIDGLTPAPLSEMPQMAEPEHPTDRPLSDPVAPVLEIASADSLPTPPVAPPPPDTTSVASDEALPQSVAAGTIPTPDEARAFYEATGVWLRAPRFFDEPSGALALGFVPPAPTESYVAIRQSPDALPRDVPDAIFTAPANPPAPDAVFDRDERGFVIATPEGAITPEGAVVFAGLPDVPIALRPQLTDDQLAQFAPVPPAPEGVVIATGTPAVLPAPRPEGLAPAVTEAATETDIAADGTALDVLELQDSGAIALDSIVIEEASADDPRPQLRPNGLAPETASTGQNLSDVLAGVVAADASLRFDNSTALAVATSTRPDGRPDGFGDKIASVMAQRAANTLVAAAEAFELENEPEATVAMTSAPQPSGPVPGGVARAATIEDAIRLREINLVGVYGRPSERRALVRLSNGRFVRVEVGSELDGGQVVAIGDDVLNYVKRGRTYVIAMPDT